MGYFAMTEEDIASFLRENTEYKPLNNDRLAHIPYDAMSEILLLRKQVADSKTVYCVGSGTDMYDSNEEGIFSTREKAEAFIVEYEKAYERPAHVDEVRLDCRDEVSKQRWEVRLNRRTRDVLTSGLVQVLVSPVKDDRGSHGPGCWCWPGSVIGYSTISQEDAIALAVVEIEKHNED